MGGSRDLPTLLAVPTGTSEDASAGTRQAAGARGGRCYGSWEARTDPGAGSKAE